MTTSRRGNRSERGGSLVEVGLVSIILFSIIFASLELSRLMLVYATMADSARAGCRYAVVHGSTRSGSGMDAASGPSADPANVVTVVRNFASAGLVDTSRLIVSVTYNDASNAPGSRVTVRTTYPYDPFSNFVPLSINVGSTTQGVIEF